MGFTTGLTNSLGIGVPHYYIDDHGNEWDANTYAMFVFDSSGSMNDIITPLTNAMSGAYFSSGSAAGQDGVKSTTSLRAELQDLYATGGIEGAPDWNTNAATNGATQYNSHVTFASQNDENWVWWGRHRYIASNSWQTWGSLGGSNEVSNVVMVHVINESKPAHGVENNDGYHWTQYGSETYKDVSHTVVSGSGAGPYTFDSISYTDSTNVIRPDVIQKVTSGVVPNVKSNAAYDQYVLSAVTSEGATINLGSTTIYNTTVSGVSTKQVTFDQSVNFNAGDVVTWRLKSYGYYTTRGDIDAGTSASLGGNANEFYTSDPINFPDYRNSVDLFRRHLSGQTQNGQSYTAGDGFYGIKDTGPNNDNRPSLTVVVVDAGLNGGNSQGNYVSGHTTITGPRAFSDTGPGNMTAQQMHTQYGVVEGRDMFHADRSDTKNYSLNDFNDLLAWNGKSNLLTATMLNRQNKNTSQSYWKDQLRAALQQNLSF